MAKRGSQKDRATRHEQFIADSYTGKRSPSSGGAITDNGDVRVIADDTLFECKYAGSPEKPFKRKPTLLSQFEKIADEAWSEGRDPALALRFYWPDSPLADADGWIDLAIRRTSDDAWRSKRLNDDEPILEDCPEDGTRWR